MAAQWLQQSYQTQQYQQPLQHFQQYQQQPQQPQQHQLRQQYQQHPQQAQQYQHHQYTQQSVNAHQLHSSPPHMQYQSNGQFQQQGQYQQQGPYQQALQYPQYQQPQANQVHQQYQAGFQGQNSFHHQHIPQQHSPQQQPPHQQHGSQYVGFVQPAQQQVQVISASPQPCFNCGNPNHFAQACPEPKRAVPAGVKEPHKFQNPLKRPRTSSSVSLQPQTHPYVMSTPSPAQAYQQSSIAQPSYSQQSQAQYSIAAPPTPASAQSPSQDQYIRQQWQHYHQWQANQQGSPQYGQPIQMGNPNQVSPYQTTRRQSIRSSSQSSQIGPTSLMSPTQHAGSQRFQAISKSTAPVQIDDAQDGDTRDASVTSAPQQVRPPHPRQSVPVTQDSQNPQDEYEGLEEDELALLDIPEMPPTSSKSTKLRLPNASLGPPIKLVCTPLPSNSVVADALHPLASPAPELKGRCQSKYITSADIDKEHEDAEYSKYWNEHQNDPIFAERPSDGVTISVEDIVVQLRQRYFNGESKEGSSISSRLSSQSPSVAIIGPPEDKLSALTSIEQDIVAEKAKLAAKLAELERKKKSRSGQNAFIPQVPMGTISMPIEQEVIVKEEKQSSPELATFEKPLRSDEVTEARLAALGVTGSPKPVETGPLPPYLGPSSGLCNGIMPTNPAHHAADDLSRLPEQFLQANGHQPLSQGDSYPSGSDGSPLTTGTGFEDHKIISTNGADQTDGPSKPLDGSIQSPTGSRSERIGSRKRSFARHDSSSDGETPARRQQDDDVSKLKRRQPRVAEAYSRRW